MLSLCPLASEVQFNDLVSPEPGPWPGYLWALRAAPDHRQEATARGEQNGGEAAAAAASAAF